MKKLICLFTILAFLGEANSMAQGLHFGLKAGVLGNKANVSGMRNQFKEESLTGFQVGPIKQGFMALLWIFLCCMYNAE